MNFEKGWYVPALRWKQGEKEGLSWLADSAKARIMPIIELIPKNFKNTVGKRIDPKKAIRKFVDELDQFWGDRPAFVDLHNIMESGICSYKNQPHLLEMLFDGATTIRPLLPAEPLIVPVTYLSHSAKFQSALKSVIESEKTGACLRITVDEIQKRTFVTEVERTLTKIGADLRECHLVVDLKFIAKDALPLQDILDGIPQLPNWRSLTLLGGSFPKDLQEYEKDNVHRITRNEWFYFREQTQLLSKNVRWPVYGDYTVQHAIYREPHDHCNPSASIRYAHEDYWVIMRGHGLTHKGSLKNDQYPAEAQLLRGMDEFCGKEFSKGDEYIEGSWKNDKKGTPMTWIRAGINHHMEFVASQVREFAETPSRLRRRA